MSLTRGQRKASRKEKNSKGYSSAEGNCQARAFSMKHFPRFWTMGRLRNLTTRFFFLCVFQCFQHRVGIAFFSQAFWHGKAPPCVQLRTERSGAAITWCFFFSSNRFIKVHVDYQGRSNTFRPCPVFILTQLSPGWCGGVLTGVW